MSEMRVVDLRSLPPAILVLKVEVVDPWLNGARPAGFSAVVVPAAGRESWLGRVAGGEKVGVVVSCGVERGWYCSVASRASWSTLDLATGATVTVIPAWSQQYSTVLSCLCNYSCNYLNFVDLRKKIRLKWIKKNLEKFRRVWVTWSHYSVTSEDDRKTVNNNKKCFCCF